MWPITEGGAGRVDKEMQLGRLAHLWAQRYFGGKPQPGRHTRTIVDETVNETHVCLVYTGIQVHHCNAISLSHYVENQRKSCVTFHSHACTRDVANLVDA